MKNLEGLLALLVNISIAFSPMMAAKIFKDIAQEQFVKTLENFDVVYPLLAQYDYPNFKTIQWGYSKELPEKIYVKLRINGRREILEVKRNKMLVNSDFNAEDFDSHRVLNTDVDKSSRDCYYTGRILNQRKSLVALSTCHGLQGLLTTRRGNFILEPMRNLSRFTFPHLIYQANVDKRQGHRHEDGKSETSSCVVQTDPNSEKYVVNKTEQSISKKFQTIKKEKESKGRRQRKRNAVELPSADVEIFVVADKETVAVHGNDSVEGYILTMMNMVAEMYRHASLGVDVNIVVAKILLLQDNQENLQISHHGDKTLRSFCEWQYSRVWYHGMNNNRILKYDAAILLTRKDLCNNRDAPCGTIGMAYIGGVCKPKRRCSVIEDIGLNTAFTIAHELGHSLGMQHDAEGNACRGETNGISHMMSPQWPQASHFGNLKWSKCSQQELKEFLSSYKSNCVREGSSRYPLEYKIDSSVFPGAIYGADRQCKQQYGPFASHCKYFKTTGVETDMCKTLWCFVEGDKECVTKLDPAAKGTPCAPGKWCMYGKCISNNTIPEQVDGGWSQWSNWTSCSRSCGVGITKRVRMCSKPYPSNGGKQCAGDSKEYRTCNIENCPVKVDFREEQCAKFNNETVTWIPVLSDRSPCVLYCRQYTNNIHYSVRFAATVTDGTPCRQGVNGVCVDGKCEQLGCDSQLRSKLTYDTCGVCGGNGTTCNVIEGEFTQMSGQGYVTAVVIPPGARSVIVQEEKPCASFLALKGERGTYHINGNWKIELPGEFDVDGTIVYYQRKGTQETFFAKGPTKEPLHIMVLFQDFNFGIKYKYTLPLKSNDTAKTRFIKKPQRGSYGWMQGPWGPCSVVCGGGITRRKPSRCIHIEGSKVSIVDNKYCSGARRPPVSEKTCNEKKCPIVWAVGDWSSCSKTCGMGRKYRTATCRARLQDGSWVSSETKFCSKDKPVTLKICVEKSCFLNWKRGPWSKCDAPCGKRGKKFREVTCPVKNACPASRKPISSRSCRTPKCSYEWIPSKWSKCSTSCDFGTQSREVVCREVYSLIESDGKCEVNLKPESKRKCQEMPCNGTKFTTTPSSTLAASTTPTGIPGAPTAARILTFDNCEKDKLAAWACEILADEHFCKNKRDVLKCCETCRRKLPYL